MKSFLSQFPQDERERESEGLDRKVFRRKFTQRAEERGRVGPKSIRIHKRSVGAGEDFKGISERLRVGARIYILL